MPPLVGARHPRFRGRLPVIGRPNADILPSPRPARRPRTYAHGREAVGGVQAWPQVHPGVVRGARGTRGGRHVSGARWAVAGTG